MSGVSNIPHPRNEPVLSYAPGTPERAALKAALGAVGSQTIEIWFNFAAFPSELLPQPRQELLGLDRRSDQERGRPRLHRLDEPFEAQDIVRDAGVACHRTSRMTSPELVAS